jgi:hypothetical protein
MNALISKRRSKRKMVGEVFYVSQRRTKCFLNVIHFISASKYCFGASLSVKMLACSVFIMVIQYNLILPINNLSTVFIF